MVKDNLKSHYLDRIKPLQRFRWQVLGLLFLIGVAITFIIVRTQAVTFTTVSVPSSIASDCSVDVASQLNAWIASQTTVNTVVNFPANGCYRAESVVQVKDKGGFYINGNGAKLVRTTGNGANEGNFRHLHIVNVGYGSVSNLIIEGQKPLDGGYYANTEDEHGVGIYGVSHIVLDNVSVSHIHGDCFYIAGHGPNKTVDLTIKNSTCWDSGRHGVAFIAADGVTITNSKIGHNMRQNFDFEPVGGDKGGANNITIDRNEISGSDYYFVSAAAGSDNVKNITISNNVLHRKMLINMERATQGRRRGPIKIINNLAEKAVGQNAIVLRGFDNGIITGNIVPVAGVDKFGNPNRFLVELHNSNNFEVANNWTSGALGTVTAVDSTNYCEYNNIPVTLNAVKCVYKSSFEAENGQISGNSSIKSDATSSAGKNLQFGP